MGSPEFFRLLKATLETVASATRCKDLENRPFRHDRKEKLNKFKSQEYPLRPAGGAGRCHPRKLPEPGLCLQLVDDAPGDLTCL